MKDQALREEILHSASLERAVADLKEELREIKKSPRYMGNITPRTQGKVSKLQAVARGFLHRLRQQRTRVHIAALSAGVLIAMKNTEQGIVSYSIYYILIK